MSTWCYSTALSRRLSADERKRTKMYSWPVSLFLYLILLFHLFINGALDKSDLSLSRKWVQGAEYRAGKMTHCCLATAHISSTPLSPFLNSVAFYTIVFWISASALPEMSCNAWVHDLATCCQTCFYCCWCSLLAQSWDMTTGKRGHTFTPGLSPAFMRFWWCLLMFCSLKWCYLFPVTRKLPAHEVCTFLSLPWWTHELEISWKSWKRGFCVLVTNANYLDIMLKFVRFREFSK